MLEIGWSTKDITTEKPVIINGQFYARVSKGVLDSLTLTALTIYNNKDYVVFLSCDMVNIGGGVLLKIRERVKNLNSEIDGCKILMNATHTHSAPMVNLDDNDLGIWGKFDDLKVENVDITRPSEYTDFFVEMAAEAVIESFEKRTEGSVSYGYGYAVVGHSRRSVYFDDVSKREQEAEFFTAVDGHARMYGNTKDEMFSHFEAGADHSANFMYTFDEDDVLTGAIVNIPCPSQNNEGEWGLSSSYWHDVKSEIRKKYGNINILVQCAAAGDLAPRTLYYREAQKRRFSLKYSDYTIDEGLVNPEELYMRRDIAIRVFEAFDEVYQWASKEKFRDLPVVHSVKTIELNKRFVTDEEYKFFLSEKEKDNNQARCIDEGEPLEILQVNSGLRALDRRFDEVLKRYETQNSEPTHPMELHVLRIGDVAFASNQFELYMDYQHRIQARSPFIQTFVVQMCAQPERNCGTYLCTERGAAAKGYSACVLDNIVSPTGGQQLVEETLKELERIHNEE